MLANLSSDKDTVEKIAKIKSGQSEVSDTMKKLQNPPESFKKVYDTLLVLYISYQGFTELAINPKWNLTSFKMIIKFAQKAFIAEHMFGIIK